MRTLATAFATCVLIAPAAVWGQLTATPNPLNFNVPTGAGLTPQNVNVTFNGSPVTITGVSASTTTGQNWLQLFVTGVLGTLTVSTNPLGLSEGTYTGTAFVATTVGSIAVQVNLNVGGATPPDTCAAVVDPDLDRIGGRGAVSGKADIFKKARRVVSLNGSALGDA